MEILNDLIGRVNSLVWGPYMLVAILGTGAFLMAGLRGMPLRRIIYAFGLLWRGRRRSGDGDISSFQALMTSLSATVGTGNIAGVATAIFLGGPGALFWMWCTALVGMATKYAEAVCAVRYRETDPRGHYVGGPMYYIKNGLGRHWSWLGTAFAIFGAIAGFGIGNMVQANSVADVMQSSFGVAHEMTGLVLMIGVALVLIGGIRRIAEVASGLVPLMAFSYLFAGLTVLAMHAAQIPETLALIVTSAFTPVAAQGGFAGAAVWAAIRFGVARGVFSNEAGLGSAPIAHAAATTRAPVEQGFVAMLGTFIDTIVICSLTGLVILVTGVWTGGDTGAALSSSAFEHALPGVGGKIVAGSLVLFAFTTLLGWSYYGERCAEYLFGVRAIVPFRLLWIVAVPVGTLVHLDTVWLLADTLNALMAVPNLIALWLLSPVVFAMTRDYFAAARVTN